MLSTNKISELGNSISEHLRELKISGSTLTIKVDDESFKKIDEDLFYRIKKESDEFTPSDSEIYISFPFLEIKIVKC